MEDVDEPTATVQRMFAAFGAGDLDALIETRDCIGEQADHEHG